MKLLIDSINYTDIEHVMNHYPIDGVTCNPSILAKNKENPYEALIKVRQLIGEERELHVQILSDTLEGILEEAKVITERLGKDTYIKVPVNELGVQAIMKLVEEGYNVTATAVYNQMQAILAAKAGAKYVAPYFNRIDNFGYDALDVVTQIQDSFLLGGLETEVLGASFKNSKQVVDLLKNGIGAVTIPTEMYPAFISGEMINQAIENFKVDFENLCGPDKTMANCK